MLLVQKSVADVHRSPSHRLLWCVLVLWLGSTVLGMWWLNPVSPATLSVCSAPPGP